MALPRGRTYTWQVVAESAGRRLVAPAPPEPDVRFRVLDASRAEALSAARSRRASHLVLGVLYAEAGLIDDAHRELLALHRDNPASRTAEALVAALPARTYVPSPTSTNPAQ